MIKMISVIKFMLFVVMRQRKIKKFIIMSECLNIVTVREVYPIKINLSERN